MQSGIRAWVPTLLFVCAGAFGNEVLPDSELVPAGEVEAIPVPPLYEQMDAGHENLSRQVVELGERLDRLFGGREYERGHQGSSMRLSLTSRIDEDGVSLQPRIRLRLALPNTERRFRFILESEQDDVFDRAGEEPRPVVYGGRDDRDRRYIAGLQYIKQLADDLDLDTDLGVRLRSRPEAFVQARIARSLFVNLWELRGSQALFARSRDGLGATTEFLAQRPLPGPRFFRSNTSATWLHDEARWFYAQDFMVSHEFSPLNAIQARVGARAESQPNDQVTLWFVNVGWRRNIYKDWLFLEIRPELVHEREDNFRTEPRLFVTLEAFFGDFSWPAAAPDLERIRRQGAAD